MRMITGTKDTGTFYSHFIEQRERLNIIYRGVIITIRRDYV
jgi:hypothetical protein